MVTSTILTSVIKKIYTMKVAIVMAYNGIQSSDYQRYLLIYILILN
jgi:hypothetical protein